MSGRRVTIPVCSPEGVKSISYSYRWDYPFPPPPCPLHEFENVMEITALGNDRRRYMRDDGSIIYGVPLVIHHG